MDPSHRHGCRNCNNCYEEEIEEEDQSELHDLLVLAIFVECVPRINVEGVML